MAHGRDESESNLWYGALGYSVPHSSRLYFRRWNSHSNLPICLSCWHFATQRWEWEQPMVRSSGALGATQGEGTGWADIRQVHLSVKKNNLSRVDNQRHRRGLPDSEWAHKKVSPIHQRQSYFKMCLQNMMDLTKIHHRSHRNTSNTYISSTSEASNFPSQRNGDHCSIYYNHLVD